MTRILPNAYITQGERRRSGHPTADQKGEQIYKSSSFISLFLLMHRQTSAIKPVFNLAGKELLNITFKVV